MNALETEIVEFDIVNRSYKKLSLDELDIDTQDKSKLYWVHYNLNDQASFPLIIEKLKLTEDVVKLCQQSDSILNLIDSNETITIKTPALLSSELNENHEESFGNLVIHLTDNYCFTAASEAIPALLDFEHTYAKNLQYAETPCFILFLVLDNIINDYAKILFSFEVISDELDVKIRGMEGNIYNEVMDLKRQVMKIKRYIGALREILMRISGRKITVISSACRASLYNLFNQSQMVVHEVDSVRDILNGFLAQIDNSLMQKMNETMRVLTAFAAIFLPLTLITGIYGMNFHYMPELWWKYGYFYSLLLLVIVAAALLYFFKKNKWF